MPFIRLQQIQRCGLYKRYNTKKSDRTFLQKSPAPVGRSPRDDHNDAAGAEGGWARCRDERDRSLRLSGCLMSSRYSGPLCTLRSLLSRPSVRSIPRPAQPPIAPLARRLSSPTSGVALRLLARSLWNSCQCLRAAAAERVWWIIDSGFNSEDCARELAGISLTIEGAYEKRNFGRETWESNTLK